MNDKILFIFIDESGNFDFSPIGTNNFVLTAISTTEPLKDRQVLNKFRYELLSQGNNQECFHATEDKQTIRDRFYDFVCSYDDFFIDSVIAQKNKANPSLYIEQYVKNNKNIKVVNGAEFYRVVSQTLLQFVFKRFQSAYIEKIVVVMDNLFTENKRQYILKYLKSYLKTYFKKPFYIYFHKTESDLNSQIADYCGWAIYIKNERSEIRPIERIKNKIKSEFPIFARGRTNYY